ncbi:MAG: TIGR00159 family protein [candidate division Zixibacteria bacterium]|nr:TIGR00159 family protein [candidate division Zixibacteria bacterium]
MEILSYQFLDFTIIDLLDVFVVAFIIFKLLELVKGTRSAQMMIGLVFIFIVAFLAYWFQLEGMKWLFSNLATVGFIVLVVVFQPEIRGGLAQIGHTRFMRRFVKSESEHAIDEVVKGAIRLSELRYGGLIVLERQVGLKNIIATGRQISAEVSSDLLTTIFTPYTPLHDGAVIIRNEKLLAAACVLPMTQNPRFANLFGMRHKAAIGVTEESDAVCLVISEETGAISITYQGRFKRDLEKLTLRDSLMEILEMS